MFIAFPGQLDLMRAQRLRGGIQVWNGYCQHGEALCEWFLGWDRLAAQDDKKAAAQVEMRAITMMG